MSLTDEIRQSYLSAQQELIETEEIDERSVAISLPLHFSGNTRIELGITRAGDDLYIISDSAQTIGELYQAGYSLRGEIRDRISEIVNSWQAKLVGNTITRSCKKIELGFAIHQLGEAAKTIGDAYLAYRHRP